MWGLACNFSQAAVLTQLKLIANWPM